MGLFKPAWMKDNEEAAIRAIKKERNVNKLHTAKSVAPSYRVRAIAFERLGNLQGAKYEIALHSPDEAECLAALDEVDWGGWDQTLVDIVLRSGKQAVVERALDLVQDGAVLAGAVARTTNGQLAMKMLDRIERVGSLSELCGHAGFRTLSASLRFEAGRRVGDCETCVSAIADLSAGGADAVLSSLETIDDDEFLERVVGQWLETAEDPLGIFGRLWEKTIVPPRIARDLEDFLCPNGHLHDLESTSYFLGADSDERVGRLRCRNCGYTYTVDGNVLLHGQNCGYTFRPAKAYGRLADCRHVVCRPGGYRCTSCGACVQPEGDAPVPCVCPTCGAENHDWEHVNGEIVHRDYSSGSSYDICRRCGKKKDIVIHGGW